MPLFYMPNRAELRIGGTRLAVADLERSLAFYCGLLGLTQRESLDDTMLLSETPEEILFCVFHKELLPAAVAHDGFLHFAFMFSHRRGLARVIKRLVNEAYCIEGASASNDIEAVYLRDPDGILVELCVPRKPGTHKDNRAFSLDLQTLLKELL